MPPKKPTPKPILLNEEQKAVVEARAGAWCVVAGPGSGKSACLVSRFAALIEEGISPDDLLSLTFTKTAAKNLRDRVEARVGPLSINRTGAGAVTFHSLALSFATEERSSFEFELAEFPLASEPIANKLCGNAARRYEVDVRTLRSFISLQKRRRKGPGEAIKAAELAGKPSDIKAALGYKAYDAAMRSEGVLDFDSLIYQMVEILDKKQEVRARWKRDWLQLDESQDMSKIEWDLARLISGKSVLAVGDVSQGIYGFRGSDPRIFAGMNSIFPGTKTLFLACNYRSSPGILNFIRPIAATKELAEKFHTPNTSGPVPKVLGFKNPQDEADFVVKSIKNGGSL